MPDEPTRLAYVILWEGAPREGTLVNRIHETVHLLSLREEHHPYLVKAHLLAYEILINHLVQEAGHGTFSETPNRQNIMESAAAKFRNDIQDGS